MSTATQIDIHRIGAKLFAADPAAIRTEALIGIFHRWIQARDLDGVPIDVADYKHVPDGPGVMLISHEADRAVDFADGRPGVIYQRKRDLAGTLEERIALVLRQADATAERLEGEADAGDVRFDRDEIELRFHDRGLVANDDEGAALVRPAVEAALAQERPGRTAAIARVEDHPRAPLTLRVSLG